MSLIADRNDSIPLVVILISFFSPGALACSTCMVGDPTQTLMGAEKPFKNRLRISLDYLSRSETLGQERINKKIIDEQRATLQLAWAPSTRLMFGVSLPYVQRELRSYNLLQQEVTTLGDISFSVKSFLQQKDSSRHRLYGLLAGLKLGTAPQKRSETGEILDFDVQAGQGATVFNAGFWYASFNYPYLVYSSASFHKAGKGRQGFQAGDALTFNVTAQYATHYKLSYYLGLEGRVTKPDHYFDIEDPDSGGNIAFLTPGIIYTLREDLLLNFVFKTPVVKKLNGHHEEGSILYFGIIYDFQIH